MRNKRDRHSLDQEASKISPPHKMSRGGFNPNFNTGSNSGPGAKQYTLNDVMMKLDRIEGEISKIWQKFEELDNLKHEVAQLRKANEGFLRQEVEQKKKCILIKGLASKSTEKYETRSETKETLDEMFNYFSLSPILEDYQRLGELKKDESENTLIRVKFATMDGKNELFQKFKEMGRDSELSKISLITDYPQFQLQEVKRLSNIAYDIRKHQKGTKTRIVPRGLGLALQSREGNGKWTTVSTNPDRDRSNQRANQRAVM
jgi:hypothetical protein